LRASHAPRATPRHPACAGTACNGRCTSPKRTRWRTAHSLCAGSGHSRAYRIARSGCCGGPQSPARTGRTTCTSRLADEHARHVFLRAVAANGQLRRAARPAGRAKEVAAADEGPGRALAALVAPLVAHRQTCHGLQLLADVPFNDRSVGLAATAEGRLRALALADRAEQRTSAGCLGGSAALETRWQEVGAIIGCLRRPSTAAAARWCVTLRRADGRALAWQLQFDLGGRFDLISRRSNGPGPKSSRPLVPCLVTHPHKAHRSTQLSQGKARSPPAPAAERALSQPEVALTQHRRDPRRRKAAPHMLHAQAATRTRHRGYARSRCRTVAQGRL